MVWNRQAIIWTNAEPFHWRIYGDELKSVLCVGVQKATKYKYKKNRYSLKFQIMCFPVLSDR